MGVGQSLVGAAKPDMPRINTSADCGDVVPRQWRVVQRRCQYLQPATDLDLVAGEGSHPGGGQGEGRAGIGRGVRSSASQALTVADRPVSNNRNQFAWIKIVVGKMPPSGFLIVIDCLDAEQMELSVRRWPGRR